MRVNYLYDKEKNEVLTGNKGIIFDIQRTVFHDGPGIRTLVFMKGCPLKCKWCANPESQQIFPELYFIEDKCIKCGKCLEICPNYAISVKYWPINRKLCRVCGKCVEICYAGARNIYGKFYTVDEVLEIVRKDIVVYNVSGGGVTIGGGEPTYQASFVKKLLLACKKEKIHTAIETCAFAKPKDFREIVKLADLILCDIKHMDSKRHQQLTGVPNELILQNIKMLKEIKKNIIFRIPLIPGLNDSKSNLVAIAKFISKFESLVQQIDILPYHTLGVEKYERLGRVYELPNLKSPSQKQIKLTQSIFQPLGYKVTIGGLG